MKNSIFSKLETLKRYHILLSVTLLIGIVVLFWFLFNKINNERVEYINNNTSIQVQKAITHVVKNIEDDYLFRVSRIFNNVDVDSFFEQKKRHMLYEEVLPYWNLLQKRDKYIKRMTFFLADGTVFLRMDNPQKFGDNVAKERPFVSDMNSYQKKMSGYETCKSITAFRIGLPVLDSNKNYLGFVEFALDPSMFVDAVIDISGLENILILKSDVIVDDNFLDFNNTDIIAVSNSHIENIILNMQKPCQIGKPCSSSFDGNSYIINQYKFFSIEKNLANAQLLVVSNDANSSLSVQIFLGVISLVFFLILIVAVLLYFLLGKFEQNVQDVLHGYINELLESEERFRELYEFAPNSYQSLDENGRILDVNTTWLDTFGYSKDEIIGKSFGDLLSEHQRKHFDKLFEAFKKRGYIRNHEYRIKTKDEKYLSVLCNGKVVYDNVGNFKQSHCIFTNITEIREREEAIAFNQSYIQTLFNASPNIVITTYGDKLDRANSAMLDFTGYKDEESFLMEHDCICELFENEKGYLQSHMHTKSWIEYILINEDIVHKARIRDFKDGHIHTFLVNVKSLEIDKENRSVAVFSDITQLEDAYKATHRLEQDKINNYEKTLSSMVSMIEKRDTYTGGHSERVAKYSKMLAEGMGYTKEECNLIYKAGVLHDIGKIEIPDSVLLKPGRLNDLEYRLMQQHVLIGTDLLKNIPMYKEMAPLIEAHHERFDGSGYPHGIKGDEIIPLARVMIVADAFDAMTTTRIYKKGMSVEDAIKELQHESKKQFHPEVVEAATKIFKNIKLNQDLNQLPENELEEQRFVYFYKDSLTGLYNSNYLDTILPRNKQSLEYAYLSIVTINNFSLYNKRFGWHEGNNLLIKISELFQKWYPTERLFRIYGDYFIILSKSEPDLNLSELEVLCPEYDCKMTYSLKSINLKDAQVTRTSDLEKYIGDFK